MIDLLERVEYRRVSVDDQFDPVYRLRYEAYRREEFIPINSQQVVRDEFDELPNVHCFGVYLDGQLVSSLRLHHMTPAYRMSPSYSVFTDILDPILDKGATILDPGRFTADHEASLAYPALPFLTLRIGVMAIKHFGVNYALSSVRPEHGAFYRRVFGSVAMSEPRYYHGLTFPMVLYMCDLLSNWERFLRRYPFFRSTQEERELLFEEPGRSTMPRVKPTARVAQRLAELEPARA
ncbi:MAG TPA: hypothetical protein GYA10_09930 [Alphaproteobacteria bacterium]|nr:hypothetical protein [Alphaproteobacteria bacterium]